MTVVHRRVRRTARARVAVVVMAVTGLMLAGCGGDGDDDATGQGVAADLPDACALVEQDEVRSALGGPAKPPIKNTQGVGSLPGAGCIFLAEDDSGDAIVISRSESDDSDEAYASLLRQQIPEEIQNVDAGDAKAFVAGEHGYAQKGSEIAAVVVSLSGGERLTEATRLLVEAAAERL